MENLDKVDNVWSLFFSGEFGASLSKLGSALPEIFLVLVILSFGFAVIIFLVQRRVKREMRANQEERKKIEADRDTIQDSHNKACETIRELRSLNRDLEKKLGKAKKVAEFFRLFMAKIIESQDDFHGLFVQKVSKGLDEAKLSTPDALEVGGLRSKFQKGEIGPEEFFDLLGRVVNAPEIEEINHILRWTDKAVEFVVKDTENFLVDVEPEERQRHYQGIISLRFIASRRMEQLWDELAKKLKTGNFVSFKDLDNCVPDDEVESQLEEFFQDEQNCDLEIVEEETPKNEESPTFSVSDGDDALDLIDGPDAVNSENNEKKESDPVDNDVVPGEAIDPSIFKDPEFKEPKFLKEIDGESKIDETKGEIKTGE
jgi:hypothetical protein